MVNHKETSLQPLVKFYADNPGKFINKRFERPVRSVIDAECMLAYIASKGTTIRSAFFVIPGTPINIKLIKLS